MLTLQALKNSLTSHLIAADIVQFQHANAALLRQYFPNYRYSDFRVESQRATAPLNTLPQLLSYQAYYAQEHFDRFMHLISALQGSLKFAADGSLSLTVFDYGCGQGLATIGLMHRLLQQYPTGTLTIYLIEPSATALALAEHYITAIAQAYPASTVTVHAHCCRLDELPQDFFVACGEHKVIHLFSNVLDLAPQHYFNLSQLVQRWHVIESRQLFLGVGPTHFECEHGMQQLWQLTGAHSIVKPVKFDILSAGYRNCGMPIARYNRHWVGGRMIALWCDKYHFLQRRVA